MATEQKYTHRQRVLSGALNAQTEPTTHPTVQDIDDLLDEYRALHKALEDSDTGRYERIIQGIQIMEKCYGIEVQS